MLASLVFLGLPCLRSDSDTATVSHCQIKTAQHVFSANPSAQYGVICSPNNYLNSRRAKILEQKLQNFWCLETIILLSEQYFCSAAGSTFLSAESYFTQTDLRLCLRSESTSTMMPTTWTLPSTLAARSLSA